MKYSNNITNLLRKSSNEEFPKFRTIKWVEIFDQPNGSYNKDENIRFKTPQVRNDLCDFNEAYIVVTDKITAINSDLPNYGNVPADANYSRKVALKNCAPFFNCILKINNQLIEDSQNLDVVFSMYNLLYYSKNFRKTTGSFWNYYPDMPSSEYVGDNERTRVFYPITNSESFNYKTKLVGNLPVGNAAELEGIKISVPLKNLSNFMFNLDFLLINAEIELILKWTQDCVLTEKVTTEAKAEVPPQGVNPLVPAVRAINRPGSLNFNVTDCKLYVPVVTLRKKYENKLYEELKTGISMDFI